METVVSVREISKVYSEGRNSLRALDGVSMDIHAGEVILLIGPSGSGKTTLLSIIGCILRPTSGSITIQGKEMSVLREKDLPPIRLKHIGFIFQGFNLFPTLTAAENVEMTLDLKGVRGRKARNLSKEYLGQVGLSDKSNAFPGDLSGGQKQRVAIARALAGEPDVILADEPTAALDWDSGKMVMDILHRMARENGRSVVVVSHDSRTLPYADRIVRIEDGRIISESSQETTGGGMAGDNGRTIQ